MASRFSPVMSSLCKLDHKRHIIKNLIIRNVHKYQHKQAGVMSSWQIYHYGNNDQLTLSRSTAIPKITDPTDVLIEVHAASVNPIDVMMRGGYGQKLLNVARKQRQCLKETSEFPLTLGRDCSGIVVDAGKAVTKFKPGDEVYGAVWPFKPGTHAEYAIASSLELAHKPSSLDHIDAASLPYVACTTWAALCDVGWLSARNTYGKRVLVLGGSGGIGSFAIQLLKSWNAEVTTTCSTDAVPMMVGLGADIVIDYKTQDVTSELYKLRGFDFVLDGVKDKKSQDAALSALKPWNASKYVSVNSPLLRSTDSYGLPFGLASTATSLAFDVFKGLKDGTAVRWAVFRPNSKALRQVAHMVNAGKIKPQVEKVYEFEDLGAAYEKVEEGHCRGKVVVKIR